MQSDEKWQQFSERMAYEGTLHLAVEAFAPSPGAIARYNERNLHVLRTVLSLDERRADNAADDDNPVMQELQRLDSKLNVLLDIVDRLLLPVSSLPARHPVRFNAVGMTLPVELLPPGAEHVLLRLHFDTCRALPLELPSVLGRAVSAQNAFVYFCEPTEWVEDGLERFVFCHHRRKVAEARLLAANENVSDSKHRV
ncbi:PilZ domain-containing protein [Dyella acidiphila]|uniref:PilZ domain-containing protein n=1 Tax=Dyella acidiphila TaxID=2775866 RepID=A0ABR9G685_9GAMM|nr:PilZ domain-containing protein [Dyella acidiphila]MBE1159519.1 PilZ domain-containing protein [Dyella acidiphila]